jgi:hypothetical protein
MSSPRRMEGFTMIGMLLFGGHRLSGVGRLRLFGPFGTAFLPLCAIVLKPPFDTLAQGVLWVSSLVFGQGLTTLLKPEDFHPVSHHPSAR